MTFALAVVRCTTPVDIAVEELAREDALHCATDPSADLAAPNAFDLDANGAQIYVCWANADGSTSWVIQVASTGAGAASVSPSPRLEATDGLMPEGACTFGATVKVEFTTLHAAYESKRNR